MDTTTPLPDTKKQSSVADQQPAKQGNSVTIKLFLNNPLRFIVDRHNEIEDAKARDERIFRDFEEKLKRYGLSREEVYFIDGTTSERRHIRNDVDLGELTHDAPVAHFYTAPPGDPPSKNRQKRQKKKTKRRSHSCSQERPHSFRCMLYRSSVPQFTITFKSKEELFQKYSQKLEELGIPVDSLYRLDSEEVKAEPVRNADDVFSLFEQTFWMDLYSKSAAEANVSLGLPYHIISSKSHSMKDFALHLQTKEDGYRSSSSSSNSSTGTPRRHPSPSRNHRHGYSHCDWNHCCPKHPMNTRLANCPPCQMSPCFGGYPCRCTYIGFGGGMGHCCQGVPGFHKY
uniref:Ubiquitinyl hydrolase 1 n=1 Tax=Haemonchus contortus TaxID=6289 RepID=A0A7I5E6K7_HAECO